MADMEPRLPLGNASMLRGVGENFAFHASPETFITSRVTALQKEHPNLLSERPIIRAKILNRNVAVISSSAQIEHVLAAPSSSDTPMEGATKSPSFVAQDAYKELMSSFFPSPNVLLADGQAHERIRRNWNRPMATVTETVGSFIKEAVEMHFADANFGSAIDLYENMKNLSWRILLGLFLELRPEDAEYEKFQTMHETLLRGQFSLMPISINAGFWQSPRQRGKKASKDIKQQIRSRLQSANQRCPFAKFDEVDDDDTSNHTLMFTSSLAVKGLSSLLTAFFLNLYIFGGSNSSLAKQVFSELEAEKQKQKLQSILYETERLSPPIVGVMRRCTEDTRIPSTVDSQPDTLIPKNWDAWLYFVGAGRDAKKYGESFDKFDPTRFLDAKLAPPLAFGYGPKSCLGADLIRKVVLECAISFDRMGLAFSGDVAAKGVQAWLGWIPETALSLEDWAADVKQIPTQHPTQPVLVQIEKKDSYAMKS